MENPKRVNHLLIIIIAVCFLSPLLVKFMFIIGDFLERCGLSRLIIYGFSEKDVLSYLVAFWTFLATAIIGYLTLRQERLVASIEEKRYKKEFTPEIIYFLEAVRVDWNSWWFKSKSIAKNEAVLYEKKYDEENKAAAKYIAGNLIYQFPESVKTSKVLFRIANFKIKFDEPSVAKETEFLPCDNISYTECTPYELNRKGVFVVLVFNKDEFPEELNINGQDFSFRVTLEIIWKGLEGLESCYLCSHRISRSSFTEEVKNMESYTFIKRFFRLKVPKKKNTVFPISAKMQNIFIMPQEHSDGLKGTQA